MFLAEMKYRSSHRGEGESGGEKNKLYNNSFNLRVWLWCIILIITTKKT